MGRTGVQLKRPRSSLSSGPCTRRHKRPRAMRHAMSCLAPTRRRSLALSRRKVMPLPHVHADGLVWFQVSLSVSLVLAACVYVRGSLSLRAAAVTLVRAWRMVSFLAGLALIWVAAGSPLATLHHQRLTVHMIQHLLLMSVAAPLIWLGAPVMPLVS